MKKLSRILSQISLYLSFIVLSTMLWSWLFSVRTDAPRDKKIVIYVDCEQSEETALAARLEEALPDGIRKVEVRLFSYAFFDADAIQQADLYIVSASAAEGYKDSFVPLPDAPDGGAFLIGGVPYGLLVHEKGTDGGAEADLITYRDPDGNDDDFYLFFGSASLHVEGNEKAVDNASAELAARLLADIDP